MQTHFWLLLVSAEKTSDSRKSLCCRLGGVELLLFDCAQYRGAIKTFLNVIKCLTVGAPGTWLYRIGWGACSLSRVKKEINNSLYGMLLCGIP